MSYLFDLRKRLWSGLPVCIGGVGYTLLMGNPPNFALHRAAHMTLSCVLGLCFSMSLERAMVFPPHDPSHNKDISKNKTEMTPKMFSPRVVSKLLLVMPSLLPCFRVFHRFSCPLAPIQVCLAWRYGMMQVSVLMVFEMIHLWASLYRQKKRGKPVQKAFQGGEIAGSVESLSRQPKIPHPVSSQAGKGDDMINVTVDFRHYLRPNSGDFLQIGQFRQRNQELEEKNLILKTQLEQQEKEIQHIEATCEKKEIQLQQCQQEKVTFREVFAEIIIQLHSSVQRFEETLEKIGGTEEKILEYQNQVGDLEQEIMVLEIELKELQDKKFELKSAVKLLEKKTTERNDKETILYLQKKLDLFIDIEQINKQIAEINERMRKIKSEREWANHEILYGKHLLLLRNDTLSFVKMCESARFSMHQSACLLDPFRTEPAEGMGEEPYSEQQMIPPLDDDDQSDGQQEESILRLDQRELSVQQEMEKLIRERPSLFSWEEQEEPSTSEDADGTLVEELNQKIAQCNQQLVNIRREKTASLYARGYLSGLYHDKVRVHGG